MAHECPDCGIICHCNGDIDDCVMNDESDIINCRHYQECEDFDDQDWDDADYL